MNRNTRVPSAASGGRGVVPTNWRLRSPAMKKGFIVGHPIPCRLVKNDAGEWVEGAWIIKG